MQFIHFNALGMRYMWVQKEKVIKDMYVQQTYAKLFVYKYYFTG